MTLLKKKMWSYNRSCFLRLYGVAENFTENPVSPMKEMCRVVVLDGEKEAVTAVLDTVWAT